jgi:hypothetical protein
VGAKSYPVSLGGYPFVKNFNLLLGGVEILELCLVL